MKTTNQKTAHPPSEAGFAVERLVLPSSAKALAEEVIACLWTLIWIFLWVNEAHQFFLWVVGIKAMADHGCAISQAYLAEKKYQQNANGLTPQEAMYAKEKKQQEEIEDLKRRLAQLENDSPTG